jgi:hypothetical protein
MKIFRDRFQLKLEFFEPPDQEFGKKSSNGNWSGVIAYVINKQAEFGIGQIAFSADRFREVCLEPKI